jgi:hypothetical protein
MVAALVLGSGLGLATPAHGAVLSCGQTITQSTVLENDVGPCNSNGIIIGADNITFNLNGTASSGASSPATGPASTSSTVRASR